MKNTKFFYLQLLTAIFILTSSSLLTLNAQNGGEPVDSSFWYRITNVWKGDGLALDVVEDNGCNCMLHLSAPEKVQGQYWRFKQVKNGWYRVFTKLQKNTKCLDIVNDGENKRPQLVQRGKIKSQLWRIVPQKDGSFQLYTMTEGADKVLDVMNDEKNTILLGNNKGYSGQFWKLTKIKQRAASQNATTRGRGRNVGKTNNNGRAVNRSTRNRGDIRASRPAPTPTKTQEKEIKEAEHQPNFLKAETLRIETPVNEAVSKTLVRKGTQLSLTKSSNDWVEMGKPTTMQLQGDLIENGQLLVPAKSNVQVMIEENGGRFLQILAVEVNGVYRPIKTNKVQITNDGDLFSPYLGSDGNFEVPIETSIPIVLEESVDLK